ncbi:helix-turn-helix domain-containing protein [Candidatus Vondammii sp. HM_W22]|uniref:helix-turn-helix domain-containing protein n=1 Tax=Candidatus Vondammii sp. HM_W22 TaxID=2687299 RepID=UPI00403DB683
MQGKSFKETGGLLNIHPNTAGQWYKCCRVGSKETLAIAKRGPKNAHYRLTEANDSGSYGGSIQTRFCALNSRFHCSAY